MEFEDLKKAWQETDRKLDRNWQLNLEIIRTTNLDKAKSKMTSLIWVIGSAIAFYGIATIYLVHLAAANWGSVGLVSTGIAMGLWSLAIVIASIHELVMIGEINYSEPITVLQKKLNGIKLTIIRYLRLAAWILPLHFGFAVLFFKILFGVDIVEVGDTTWIISNLALGFLVFLPLTIWIHRKLSPKNADKKWMNSLLKGQGSQITTAIGFLKEIEKFEKSE